MKTEILTTIVLAFVLIAVAVYDIWVALFVGGEPTVSKVTLGLSRAHPILPFAVGVLVGHLFWPQSERYYGTQESTHQRAREISPEVIEGSGKLRGNP